MCKNFDPPQICLRVIRTPATLSVSDNRKSTVSSRTREREGTLQKTKDTGVQFWDTKWKSGTLGGNSGTPSGCQFKKSH